MRVISHSVPPDVDNRDGLYPYQSALRPKMFYNMGDRRRRYEDPAYYLNMRQPGPFVSDECRINNSLALKRLKYKAQVFPDPQNPHVRDRDSHTREAVSVSLVMASILGLNEDLCRAIMLAHDLGHTPFGHGGEAYIKELAGRDDEFEHQKFGVIVAQTLEDPRIKGKNSERVPTDYVPKGLNLSYPVLEGILYHSRNKSEMAVDAGLPEEFTLCMYADKLAYTFADVDDAVRLGRIPRSAFNGRFPSFDFDNMEHEQMQTACMKALVVESAEQDHVSFKDSQLARDFVALRDFMYEEVYYKIDWRLHRDRLGRVYEFLQTDSRFLGTDQLTLLCMMTDNQVYAISDILARQERVTDEDLYRTGIDEFFPFVRGRKIDYNDIDLDPKDFGYY